VSLLNPRIIDESEEKEEKDEQHADSPRRSRAPWPLHWTLPGP
jgi:hypothetical protein